ncbi:hypothetical protein C2W62_24140 [Candidatus Entotheonella serta]|nr:hypothetical protein C2W62_24140 [Candidatus Entotheonella serta]
MPSWLRRELSYLDPQVRLLMLVFVSVALGILVAAGLSGPPDAVDRYAMTGFGALLGSLLAVLMASLRADLLASGVQIEEIESDDQDASV